MKFVGLFGMRLLLLLFDVLLVELLAVLLPGVVLLGVPEGVGVTLAVQE